jgi:ABC-2 type transport system permease protein
MILASIFRYELRALLRSRARCLALAVFWLCGIYALYSGQQQVARWEAILTEATGAQAQQQEDVRSWHRAGATGPSDRPWIDITAPTWADRVAGSHMGRSPAPLASLSLGLSDARAEATHISLSTNPYDGKLIELANPEKLLAGHLDLAFVLAFLVPLLLLVLVFDVGGYERDSGMLSLVRVQRGRLWPWLVARLGFHAALVAGSALVLVLIGGAWSGALRSAPGALAAFALLGLLYVLVWSALFTCVASLGRGSAFNALTMSVIWIVLCILGPAAAQSHMQHAHPPGYGTELTSLLREETHALSQRDFALHLQVFYSHRPHLRSAPYAREGERDRNRNRLVIQASNLDVISRRAAEQQRRELAEERTAARLRAFLPSFALLHGLNLLAGNEAAAYREFRADILASVEARLEFMLDHAWNERPIDGEAFERLIALAPAPRAYAAPPDLTHYGSLALWALLPALFAGYVLRPRPGPGGPSAPQGPDRPAAGPARRQSEVRVRTGGE